MLIWNWIAAGQGRIEIFIHRGHSRSNHPRDQSHVHPGQQHLAITCPRPSSQQSDHPLFSLKLTAKQPFNRSALFYSSYIWNWTTLCPNWPLAGFAVQLRPTPYTLGWGSKSPPPETRSSVRTEACGCSYSIPPELELIIATCSSVPLRSAKCGSQWLCFSWPTTYWNHSCASILNISLSHTLVKITYCAIQRNEFLKLNVLGYFIFSSVYQKRLSSNYGVLSLPVSVPDTYVSGFTSSKASIRIQSLASIFSLWVRSCVASQLKPSAKKSVAWGFCPRCLSCGQKSQTRALYRAAPLQGRPRGRHDRVENRKHNCGVLSKG